MKHVAISKTAEGRARLNTWYDMFTAKISAPVTSASVPTSAGASHVLVAGPADAPPLVCLHGMRTGASFLLSELSLLLEHFRVYAPDLPGQSVRGPEVSMPLNDATYAEWLAEVMDGLEVHRAHLLGISWGGFVARLLASHAPDRVHTLTLMMPAGIANGSHFTGLVKMVGPLLRHKLRPSPASLKALVDPIMTTWDAEWAGALDGALRDMKMDPRVPPLATDDALRQLAMRTLVIAGALDISFPGNAVVERVERLIPNVQTELLNDAKHCPPTTPAFRQWMAERVIRFIGEAETR